MGGVVSKVFGRGYRTNEPGELAPRLVRSIARTPVYAHTPAIVHDVVCKACREPPEEFTVADADLSR